VTGVQHLLPGVRKCFHDTGRGGRITKANLAMLALLFLTSFSAAAQQLAPKDPLLDRLAGSWILRGTIAGHETTHDIEAEWVLGHAYLRLHEISREKNAQAQPAYEAIISIEWIEALKEYKCLWLDSTGGGGLAAPMGTGERLNDSIGFVWRDQEKDSGVNTTFGYRKGTDSWSWVIDNIEGDKVTVFAHVKLTRK
jgi:hypothetical protein